MKKLLTAVLTAAMVIGSVAPAAMAEELETEAVLVEELETEAEAGLLSEDLAGLNFDASAYVSTTEITRAGETLTMSSRVYSDEDNDVAFDISFILPESLVSQIGVEGLAAGEEYMLEDICRVVDNSLYINVGGALSFVESLSGSEEGSMAGTLSMLGITDWLEIPPVDLTPLNEQMQQNMEVADDEEVPQVSEELISALTSWMSAINIVTTEDTIEISYNTDTLYALTGAIDTIITEHKDEVQAFITFFQEKVANANKNFDTDVLFDVFGGYVDAYAEGRALVTEEDPAAIVDELKAMAEQIVSVAVEQGTEMIPGMDGTEEEGGEEGEAESVNVTEKVQAALEGKTIEGRIVIGLTEENQGIVSDDRMWDAEGNIIVEESSVLTPTELEEPAVIDAPEGAVSSYEIVKNVSTLYYSLQAMSQQVEELESGSAAE